MAAMAAGLAEPVADAQAIFRACLTALSRPGLVQDLPSLPSPPSPLTPELAAVALALADPDAPIWLDAPLSRAPAVTEYLRFQTGAPLVSKAIKAAFALVSHPSDLLPAGHFALGTQDYPDRSTTIVLAVDSLSAGDMFRVGGPGVKGSVDFFASPLPADFLDRAQANNALFPLGVDWLLVGAGRVVGLPRTARLSLVPTREAA